MAQAEILIDPTTAAVLREIFVAAGDVVPLSTSGLATGEVIAIECMTPAGYAQYVASGTSIQLSTTMNKIAIDVPGRYRVNKPTTASAAGVLRDAA